MNSPVVNGTTYTYKLERKKSPKEGLRTQFYEELAQFDEGREHLP